MIRPIILNIIYYDDLEKISNLYIKVEILLNYFHIIEIYCKYLILYLIFISLRLQYRYKMLG